jgi:Glycosyl transferase family 2
MHLTIAAIAKNEGAYVEEWIAHHSLLGFDQIILMDNGSTDDMASRIRGSNYGVPILLEPWPTFEGISTQMACYNHILQVNKEKTDAIAFIDIDEFIIETGCNRFKNIASEIMNNPECGALVINQRVFGSNGHEQIVPGLVLDRFPLGSEIEYVENEWVKTIYKCSAVDKIINSHSSPLKNGKHFQPSGVVATFKEPRFATELVDHAHLQLNHYITKSFEEFLQKRQRGGVMASTDEARRARYADDGFFRNRQYGTNKVLDEATRKAALSVKAVFEKRQMATSEK